MLNVEENYIMNGDNVLEFRDFFRQNNNERIMFLKAVTKCLPIV